MTGDLYRTEPAGDRSRKRAGTKEVDRRRNWPRYSETRAAFTALTASLLSSETVHQRPHSVHEPSTERHRPYKTKG